MGMRMIDISCDGEVHADGRCTLTITAKNLTLEEAHEIGELASAPFRAIVMQVMSKDGSKAAWRDMKETVQ